MKDESQAMLIEDQENELVTLERKEVKVLDEKKAAEIIESFDPHVAVYVEVEPKINALLERYEKEGISPEICLDAKELRLEIRKARTGAEQTKKEQKDVYLKVGNAIQGVFNIIKKAVEDKESKLSDIENYYENQEKERIQKLTQERVDELLKYEIEEFPAGLGEMTDQIWNAFLKGVKSDYEDRKAEEAAQEEERKEQQRKVDLYQSRKDELFPLGQYVDNINELTTESTEEEFQAIKAKAEAARDKARAAQEEKDLKNRKFRDRMNALKGVSWNGTAVIDFTTGTALSTAEAFISMSDAEFETFRAEQEKRYTEDQRKKNEAAEAEKEKTRLANASDSEKLSALAEHVREVERTINSPAAKSLLRTFSVQLKQAAKENR